MEKWIQKLSGALIASVLALTLSTKASADLQEEDPDPDQPLPQYEDNLAEDGPEGDGSGDEEPGSGEADPDVPEGGFTAFTLSSGAAGDDAQDPPLLTDTEGTGEGETPAPSSDPQPAGDSGETGDTGDTGDTGSDTDPGTVSIGGTTYTPGEDAGIDLSGTTSDENDLFGFDAGDPDDAGDDCFYMVNYNGSGESLSSEDSDINIVAAGLNQLGSILADGDVNVTGTGILLVDQIQVAEGCGFYLHPIEGMYDSGSVAVFLLTSPADSQSGANAVYTLINGAVPGILDEEYVLPAGIDLVLPDGSSLILQSTVQETIAPHADEEGHPVPQTTTVYTTQPDYSASVNNPDYSYEYSAGRLTIPASSGLTVQEGASIVFVTLQGQYGGQNILPVLDVYGSFSHSGTIDGGTQGGIVLFGTTSHVSGSGVYKDCRLYFNSQDPDSQSLTFNIVGTTDSYGKSVAHLYVGCDLKIDNAVLADDRPVSIGTAGITGSCSVIVADGSSIGTIDLKGSSSAVTIYAHSYYGEGCAITLRDGITGSGTVVLASGNYLITNEQFVLSNSVTVTAIGSVGDNVKLYAVTVSDVSGTLSSRLTVTDLGIRVDPDDTTVPSDPVPVFIVYIESYQNFWDNSVSWAQNPWEAGIDDMVMDMNALGLVSDGKILYSALQAFFAANLAAGSDSARAFVEVYSISNGVLTRHVIDASGQYGAEDYIDADEIYQLRIVNEAWRSEAGGTSVMSTNTSMTGSGVIGGSGAGSVSGGTGTQINIPVVDNGNGNGNGNNGNGNDDPSPVIHPQPAPQQDVAVSVTELSASDPQAASLEELQPVYSLSATADGQVLTELSGSVTVRFSCPAPQTGGMIFAVFRAEDGSLKAFRARYDRISGQLVFQTDLLGDFAVVCIDYDGELYSDEFYALLESFDSVRSLL